jgi:predicted hydrocarbon binding protein
MGFRDRLAFDAPLGEYRDGAIRYMMIRPDALMGLLHELPTELHAQVLEAFARSITRQGGRSAQSYRDAGAVDGPALVETIAKTAPQLGWGIWDLRITSAGLDLSVTNSPFAAGFGPSPHPVCHPIIGMLTAVGRMVLGGDVQVTETSCASVTKDAPCRFEVRPAV